MGRYSVLWVVLGIWMTCGVSAQPCARAQTLQQVEQARVIADEARRQAREGNYRKAVEGFKRAYAIKRDPAYLYNISLLYLKALKQPMEAWEYAMRCLDEVKASKDKQDALELKDAAERLLRKRYGKLVISVTPTTAELRLDRDSQEARIRWHEVFVNPGKHVVYATAPGYQPASADTLVRVGLDTKVSISLVAEKATIKVESNTPSCEVFIDGKLAGRPPFERKVMPGRHVLAAQADGYQRLEKEMKLGPGEIVLVKANLVPLARKEVVTPVPVVEKGARKGVMARRRTWGYVCMGGGAALAATGAVLLGVGYKEVQSAGDLEPGKYDSEQAYDSAFDGRVASGKKKVYAGYGLIGAGAAAAVTGLVLYLTGRDSVPVGLRFGPSSAVVSATVRW